MDNLKGWIQYLFTDLFNTTSHFISNHPIALYTILATSFMAATLTLFLIRPARKFQAHWI